MNKIELDYFYKNYPLKYISGKNETYFISETRLPKLMFDFVMEDQEQAKTVLVEQVILRFNNKTLKIKKDIDNDKKILYKSLMYDLLPIVCGRFYNEIKIKIEEYKKRKEINKINKIKLSKDNINYEDFNFKYLTYTAPFFIVYQSEEGVEEEILVKVSNYTIDEKNKKIKLNFKTFYNKFEIMGNENDLGEIVFSFSKELKGVFKLKN